jgi:hypothetical protein
MTTIQVLHLHPKIFWFKSKKDKERARIKFDKMVKRKTGFKTESDMLSFIFMVCNGDINSIITSRTINSTLTWYEEWFVYFQKMWGRTLRRWHDMADKKDGYGIHTFTLSKIFDGKAAQVFCCRLSWPVFASFEEEDLFDSKEMNERYKDHRLIFWDMTNVVIPKPSDAEMQRLSHSKYYSCNCFKGGIGLQNCGWIITHNLWTGCVSDTDYQAKSGIFKKQDDFSEQDFVEEKKKPFTNIFDKGYRNRLIAWQSGEQITLQPAFAKSDEKFNRKDTLSSAIVASDRSSNERAVRMAKMSAYVKDGLSNHQSLERMHYAWLNWGFQVNFMYNAVL